MNLIKKFLIKSLPMAMALGLFAMSVPQLVMAQAPMVKPLPTDPQLITGTLPNGLTYFIRHNDHPKNRADFYIAQRVGSILENDSQSGLAHFLEHMAFNGTKHFPGKNLINYLENNGVKFGANLNAYTSFDETVYTIMDAPTTRPGLIDSCMLILHDWSHCISLEGKEIDDERGVIHEEWRTRDNGNLRNFEHIMQDAFPNNKYAKRMPIGSMDVVMHFKHKVLRDYYHKWYRPDLQAIIIVGDIDAKKTEAELKKMFADIPKPVNPAKRIYTPVEINEQPIAGVATDPEATNSSVMITFKETPMPDSLKMTQFGVFQDYVNTIITSMINTRLSDIAQKPNAPFNYAGVNYDLYMGIARTMDAFSFSAYVKEGGYEAGLKALAMEIEKIRKFGFTEGEYQRAVKDFMVSMKNLYNERDKRKNKSLANEYVSYFTRGGYLCDIPTQYKLFELMSQQIKLPLINQMAKQFFGTKGVGIFVSGPKKANLKYPTDAELLKQWMTFSNLPVQPYKDQLSNQKLIDSVPTPGKIVKEENGKYGTTIWTLANGAKVIFKVTNFKDDEIILSATRSGGLLSLPTKDVLYTKVINGAMNVGGLGKFSSTDLDKVLSGHLATITPSIGSSYTNIDGSTTKEDLKTMMQLLYLNFTAKRSDKEAYQAWKQRTISAITMAKDNPISSLSDSINSAVYGKIPFYESLKVKDLDHIQYDKVMQLYKEFYNGAKGFTFFFIGNIDKAKLKNLVETYIASLPAGKGPMKIVYPPYPRKGKIQNFYSRKITNPMAVIVNIFSGKIKESQENEMRLSMLSDVMDQVYTASIREKEGGTYGVSTQGNIRLHPKNDARFMIFFQTSPEKALFLNNIAMKELQDVAKNGAAQVNFDKVVKNMYKNHNENLTKNGYWLDQMQNYYLYGKDYVDNWETTLKAITPKMLGETAKELLDQNNLIQVILYTAGHKLQ